VQQPESDAPFADQVIVNLSAPTDAGAHFDAELHWLTTDYSDASRALTEQQLHPADHLYNLSSKGAMT
jgi:hypothetical protein